MAAGSPFECSKCPEADKDARNCLNRFGLSPESAAVTGYTDEVKAELKEKGAKKVFSLGDIRLYECPLSYLTAETGSIMRLVYLVEDTKILLHAGGWGGQPHWLVEGYEIFRAEQSRELSKKAG